MPVGTTTGATYALNIGVVGIVGTFLGMPLEALILGALAGAFVQGRLNPSTRMAGISNVLISTILAGAFSPIIAQAVSHVLYAYIGLGADAENVLRAAIPVLLGGAWPWILPIASKAVTDLVAGFVRRIGGPRE